MSDLERLMAFLARQPDMTDAPMDERRAAYDRAEQAFTLPDGVTTGSSTLGDVPGDLLKVRDAAEGRNILYLHGGGYGIGSSRSHRHLAAAIGAASRADVALPDYRLAPEHKFPGAVDDALAVYRALLDTTTANCIAIAGDSAGGGLVVAAILAARNVGLPLPGAAVCLSPWVDLTCAPDSPVAKAADGDPLVRYRSIANYARAYLGETPADLPLASPIFADLRGLPPMLIHASKSEALLSDATRLADVARRVGVDVTIELTDGTPHVWHWFWPRLDVARELIRQIGVFLDRHLPGSTATRQAVA